MKLLVTGATGTAGAEVVRQAILDKSIEQIVCLVRSPMSLKHEKVTEVIHGNFLDYSSLKDLPSIDACIWCLGISQSQVDKTLYHTITYDYVIAAATYLKKQYPNMTFVFLSGMGADQAEKSTVLFSKIKGKAENALKRMNFDKLYFARPGGIMPIHKNPKTAFVNKMMYPLFPILRLLAPGTVITAAELAVAMLELVKNKPSGDIYDNNALRALAKRK